MTRFKFHSPFLSQYSGHLVYIFTHFFSSPSPLIETLQVKNLTFHFILQSLPKSVIQMQLSFEAKSVVTGLFFQTLCAHFACGERKERKKGNLLLCHLD